MPAHKQNRTLESYKKEHAKIAEQLCYGKATVTRIKRAKSKVEVDNIMTSARRASK